VNPKEISQWIKTRAPELGFSACGIVRAGHLDDDGKRLHQWLQSGYHGEMGYMERNVDKRADPVKLVPGAKSVIVVLMNYFPEKKLTEKDNYKIASYAYGKDYHDVIRGRLNQMITEIAGKTGPVHARAFTDSAPVLERALAEMAGLGWIGKNTCLIHPKIGSFFFIGEIITDLVLEYDDVKINDLCGGCTKCIDACPTAAIVGPRLLDSRKCISYLTIEFKGNLPEMMKEHFSDWIFGCDICQDVCPWNRKAVPGGVREFRPLQALEEMNKERWENLSEEVFRILFRGSAVKRTKFSGLKRNINFLKSPRT
jgi:epoxyqueuosine reductase